MSALLCKLLKVAEPNRFRMLVPFAKFEKLDDGRLMIEGIATSEALDHSGEIVDYESAKAAFAEWPGNIREQHDTKKAVGRALEILADDRTKTIRVKSFISKGAPNTQDKILDGTLTCYSIGGSVKARKPEKMKKADGTEVNATRLFIEKLSETSVVDEGCNPETSIALVKAADGGELLAVGLEGGADVSLDVKGSPDDVAAFAKALNDAGMTMVDATGLVAAAVAKRTEAKSVPFAKSMYSVQELASCCTSLMWLCRSAIDETTREGDGSPLPDRLKACAAELCSCLVEMASEETREALAELGISSEKMLELSGKAGALAKGDDFTKALQAADRVGELKKSLDEAEGDAFDALVGKHLDANEVIATLRTAGVEKRDPNDALKRAVIAKAAKVDKLDTALLQKTHDHIAALGAACAGKEASAPAGDLSKAVTTTYSTTVPLTDAEVMKALSDSTALVTKLQGELASARKDIDMLKAQPVSRFVTTLRTVTKGEERDPAYGPISIDPATVVITDPADFIKNADGSIDWATSRVIKANRLEEQELARRRAAV